MFPNQRDLSRDNWLWLHRTENINQNVFTDRDKAGEWAGSQEETPGGRVISAGLVSVSQGCSVMVHTSVYCLYNTLGCINTVEIKPMVVRHTATVYPGPTSPGRGPHLCDTEFVVTLFISQADTTPRHCRGSLGGLLGSF